MEEDPTESNDLSAEHPDLVRKFEKKFQTWWRSGQ